MKLRFKVGILYKLVAWYLEKLVDSDDEIFLEMDRDARMLGSRPRGDAHLSISTIYGGAKFCTSNQLRYLIKKLKRITKKL